MTVGSPQTRPKTPASRRPRPPLSPVSTYRAVRSVSLEQGAGTPGRLPLLRMSELRDIWSEFQGDFDLPTPDTRTVIVTKGPESESPSKVRDLAPPG